MAKKDSNNKMKYRLLLFYFLKYQIHLILIERYTGWLHLCWLEHEITLGWNWRRGNHRYQSSIYCKELHSVKVGDALCDYVLLELIYTGPLYQLTLNNTILYSLTYTWRLVSSANISLIIKWQLDLAQIKIK